jgi:hypothetical protein
MPVKVATLPLKKELGINLISFSKKSVISELLKIKLSDLRVFLNINRLQINIIKRSNVYEYLFLFEMLNLILNKFIEIAKKYIEKDRLKGRIIHSKYIGDGPCQKLNVVVKNPMPKIKKT